MSEACVPAPDAIQGVVAWVSPPRDPLHHAARVEILTRRGGPVVSVDLSHEYAAHMAAELCALVGASLRRVAEALQPLVGDTDV